MRTFFKCISISFLILIHACSSSSGGGGGDSANTQSGAANITRLVVAMSGAEYTIEFNGNGEYTVYYPYGLDAPESVIVMAIIVSDHAIASVAKDATIDVANDKVTIMVTAQDGSEQTYTITFVEVQPSSEAEITSLIVTVLGKDHTIAFDANREAAVSYLYGTPAFSSVIVKDISVSDYATVSVAKDATIDVVNDKATITVTAQDGTTVQTYTINRVQTLPSSEADITSLVITVSGIVQSIDFDASKEASVYYPYNSDAPASVTIKSIDISAEAIATVGSANANDSAIVSVTDGKVIITVTAQDGTSNNTYSILLVEYKTLMHILDTTVGTSTVPTDFSQYDELTKAVLSPYNAGATLVAKYITISGGAAPQGGTLWSDAAPADQLKPILDGISDATSDRVYLILVASGTTADSSYDAGEPMEMKNHVAIIGGWDASGDWSRSGSTVISGGGSHQVFSNGYRQINPIGPTALLYGLTITAGFSGEESFGGAGMFNNYSSPTLTNIVFSGNSAKDGGAMYNVSSSLTLTNIIFSGNSATGSGGGMYNYDVSSTMTNIVFSGNSATGSGGGMYNSFSSATLTNVTFSANSAPRGGGGMLNEKSYLTMTNIVFSGNSGSGGGMFNDSSSMTLINITFSDNSAGVGAGGAMYHLNSAMTMINATFSGNSAGEGGGMYIVDGGYNNTETTIVNAIFWDNTATGKEAQIYVREGLPEENVTLAYSVVEGVLPSDVRITTNPVTDDPSLSALSTDTGSSVATRAISTGSSAIDAGVYARRLDYTDQSGDAKSRWYYSEDNSNWYTGFDSSGLTDSTSDTAATAEGSIDITATDATGTARSGRPDAGSYEAR